MQVIIAELADIECKQAAHIAEADAEQADRPATPPPKPHDKRPSVAGRGTPALRRNIPKPSPKHQQRKGAAQ